MPHPPRQLTLPIHRTLPEHIPAPGVCQRWRDRRHSWTRRRDGGFDQARYTVAPIGETTAKTYVLAHHYLHSYPAASRRYGLYIHEPAGPALVGVAVFGVPASRAVLAGPLPELEPYRESLVLSRFVLEGDDPATGKPGRAPGNAESWFLSRCFRDLSAAGIHGVVTFADPVPRTVAGRTVFPGHWGTIYQASNAIHLGRATPRTLTVLPDGATLSDRAMSKVRNRERGHDHVVRQLVDLGAPVPRGPVTIGWLHDALHAVGATRLRHRGCLRYVMFTSRAARRTVHVNGTRYPYPKER